MWTAYAVLYTVGGSGFAIGFTWVFTRISYEIERREADWRFTMVNVRTNAEAIAFYNGESIEKQQVLDKFELVIEFVWRSIGWGMIFGLYNEFYNIGLLTVPNVLLNRLYFQGKLDFGGMGQVKTSFGSLSGNLNFLLNSSGKVAQLATSVTRLGGILQHTAAIAAMAKAEVRVLDVSRMEIRSLSVKIPDSVRTLVENLTLTVGSEDCMRLLIIGRSGVGKSSLLRTIAGLWPGCSGEIARPRDSECVFLPQQPYMPLGNLRTQLRYPSNQSNMSVAEDAELKQYLGVVGLGDLPDRFHHGWEQKEDWKRVLSLGEQQRVAAIIGVLQKPKMIMLDEATSALSDADEELVYSYFTELKVPLVSIGHRKQLLKYHDHVLKLCGGGKWELLSTRAYEEQCSAETTSEVA